MTANRVQSSICMLEKPRQRADLITLQWLQPPSQRAIQSVQTHRNASHASFFMAYRADVVWSHCQSEVDDVLFANVRRLNAQRAALRVQCNLEMIDADNASGTFIMSYDKRQQ